MPAALPRVILITPNPGDAELAAGFLTEHGIAASAYNSVSELGGVLPAAAACIILVEEALFDPDMPGLRELLENQPAWSDLPLILIASAGVGGAGLRAMIERVFPNAGNLTLLERPLNPLTLVSAAQVGMRARARQLEVRDLIEKRDDALRLRDEFLAMLAHELRNPLAPMRAAVYLQKTIRTQDELLSKTREILERQVTHISRLVDDLLDVARLEHGKVHLQRQRLDLNGAVTAALEACLPALQARDHRLRISLAREPLPIDADPVRLEQLLSNLLVNACKFTPTGGEIAVQTRIEGEMASVQVTDNGIGIRADMIERIFSPFVQDDQTLARSAGGLGIGLSIARKVAALHGGTLRAHSEGLDKGAVFEAQFPLAAPAEPAQHSKGRSLATGIRRRVLVVEDNPDIRETLRMVLDVWGHDVTLAGSADEGLAAALRGQPDIALIDIGLPGMSGYEVAQRIRAQSQSWARRIKLVAVTGYGQPSDRERALVAGFDHHLLKPVDPDVLQAVLAG